MLCYEIFNVTNKRKNQCFTYMHIGLCGIAKHAQFVIFINQYLGIDIKHMASRHSYVT